MFAAVLLTSISGWLSAILVGATTALPYVFRRKALNQQIRSLGPFLLRMKPHYWIGYVIVGLSTLHASLAMNKQTMSGTNMFGLLLATGALFLMFWQLIIGLSLRQPTEGRRTQRRWHFTVMLGIVSLGIGHIALNSVLARVLFP